MTFIFSSPYEQYANRVGQEAEIVGEVDSALLDEEVGTLYLAQFPDGTVLEVWPEEVDPMLMGHIA